MWSVRFRGKRGKVKKLSGDISDKAERPNRGARNVATPLAREIDENLKRVYQAALSEEVPDRFRLLLAQLREKEGKS
ncbi:MAG: hypothetical protein KF887_19110 [Paracoccaceae bacterium]|nr:MAG: hypothetical protein KF887_19110 [Paracoccaceae bacterium]